jgi:hypothetical protein
MNERQSISALEQGIEKRDMNLTFLQAQIFEFDQKTSPFRTVHVRISDRVGDGLEILEVEQASVESSGEGSELAAETISYFLERTELRK